MPRFFVTLAALALVSGLGACGQSGPLYLPGNPSELSTAASETAEGDGETPAQDSDRRDASSEQPDRDETD